MPPVDDIVAADPSDLLALGGTAASARAEIEAIVRQAGSIIGGLDGRGWDIGAVQARWSSARSGMGRLADDLAAAALELLNRATLVELFESGLGFGMGLPYGLLPGELPPGFMLPGLGSPFSPESLLGWGPWSSLLMPQAGLVNGTPGAMLPGYSAGDLSSMSDIFFDGFSRGQFGESRYSKTFSALAFGGPAMQALFTRRGKLALDPTVAAIAERARQLALIGSPAGSGRRLNAIDKLDPTLGFDVSLLDANASVYNYAIGGKNASLSIEALAAHANASAGLSLDLQRRRLSANFAVGASANLVDLHAHAGDHFGDSALGAGGDVTGDAAVGANADARAGLTVDALKGRVSGDVGADAFAGASATATGSVEGDLAGAKTTVTGTATAYAGVGIGVKADGTFDVLHGKFGFKADVGAALGIGAKFDVGVNVDVSGVPHTIEHAASSVLHGVEHLIPHISFP